MLEPKVKAQEPPRHILRFQTEWCRVTLASIGDAVTTTNNLGRITQLNLVAASLADWNQKVAEGVPAGRARSPSNQTSRFHRGIRHFGNGDDLKEEGESHPKRAKHLLGSSNETIGL